MTALLELQDLGHQFDGVRALDGINLKLEEGEVVGLIGPNGAGKTTLVNVITGVYRPGSGRILYRGRRLDGMPSYQIARLGIARTFQVVQPFPRMTVLENVAAAALFAGHAGGIRQARHEAAESLAFCGLDKWADKPAGALPLAGRKRLELAKSLALKPRLLLLDEVNAGLNQTEIDEALGLIRGIAARGITIILIEHLMKVVLNASTRLVVLHHGRLLADGSPQQVVADPLVMQAYLGRRYAEQSIAEEHA